jgi:hypothetical protein
MNNIALIPDLCVHFLQRQNIKHNSMQKFIEDKEPDEEITLTEEVEEKSDKNVFENNEINKVD